MDPKKTATKPKITMVLAEHGANVMAKVASSRSRLVSIILQERMAEHCSRSLRLRELMLYRANRFCAWRYPS